MRNAEVVPRLATGGIGYHVLNRRVSRLPLFEKPADYNSFEKILAEATSVPIDVSQHIV
jgi:hypothetical protein